MNALRLLTGLLVAATLGAGTGRAAPAETAGADRSVRAADAGSLAFRATFRVTSSFDVCPPGTPSGVNCYPRTAEGLVRGLGRVTESYVYPVQQTPSGCPVDAFRVLAYPARFTIAGKGTIDLSVPTNGECLGRDAVLVPRYPPVTITGGTGTYAGASGSGTLVQNFSYTASGAAGADLWVGTLNVPSFDFDLTPPTLTGAAAKTVRTRRGLTRAVVTYTVGARDEVDGVIPASCLPRSGSRFKIGRTTVQCSARDRSANTVSASFVVTVKRG